MNRIKNIKNNVWVAKLKNVAKMAYFPIYLAVYSSLSSKNVYCCYTSNSYWFLNLESFVLFPTQHTTAFPEPVNILELEKRKGSGCSLWLFSSSASVPKYFELLFKTHVYFLLYMLWSAEIFISSIIIQSAGTLSPYWRSMTSPTTKSLIAIDYTVPWAPL